MKITTAILTLLLLSATASADGKKFVPEHYPQTRVIVEHQHDGAGYALVGAAVTWWLLHRREKRHHVTTCELRDERLREACGK
jgi:hypothetical protein